MLVGYLSDPDYSAPTICRFLKAHGIDLHPSTITQYRRNKLNLSVMALKRPATPAGCKILHIDIETAPAIGACFGMFKQNLSVDHIIEDPYILGFSYLWDDEREKGAQWVSVKNEGRKAMLELAWDLMDEANYIVHINGTRFDVPWLQGEFMKDGIRGGIPPSSFKNVDLQQQTHKKKFRTISNKLDYITNRFLCLLEGKIHTEGITLWLKCMGKIGTAAEQAQAWVDMETYANRDVDVMPTIFDKYRPWIKGLGFNLYSPGEEGCPNCGRTDTLTWGGFTDTDVSRYDAARCDVDKGGCGTPVRSTRRRHGVSVR